eukprot:330944-Lingulodinium_polyedra.AAC.1
MRSVVELMRNNGWQMVEFTRHRRHSRLLLWAILRLLALAVVLLAAAILHGVRKSYKTCTQLAR